MAKILNVQEFIQDQTQLHKDRRLSQYLIFLNKTPAFPIYYAINKIQSTSELNTNTIDQYIGADSPIRFDKIENMPIFGVPEFSSESEFDETIGTNTESFTAESIVVPGMLVPTEGECFILTYFNQNVLFIINNVSEVNLKARPHFRIQYSIDSSDKIPQLERQVVGNYKAIFENIGTDNSVIIEDSNYKRILSLKNTYKSIHDYYIKKFFDNNTSTFGFTTNIFNQNESSHYTDKFLEVFMKNTRTLIFDNITKSIFSLDTDNFYYDNEFPIYEKSLWYAIENHTKDLLQPSKYIHCYPDLNPFTIRKAMSADALYISEDYWIDQSLTLSNNISYDISYIKTKIDANDITIVSDKDKLYNILVKYLNNIEIPDLDFDDLIFLQTDIIDQYYMFPLILYILSLQINILQKQITNTFKVDASF